MRVRDSDVPSPQHLAVRRSKRRGGVLYKASSMVQNMINVREPPPLHLAIKSH